MTDAPAIKQNANGIWFLEGEQLWDSDLLPIILEYIKEGDTVIDAGAWIGGHTMAYAEKVGEKGKVIAIEPNPYAFECMSRNTRKFHNVLYGAFALGDKIATVSFSAKKGWYDSGFVGQDDTICQVIIHDLDSLNVAPNFIKIDVEGCELKVLKGAKHTIFQYHPRMVIEVNREALNRQGNTPDDVFLWLEKYDYGWEVIKAGEHNPEIYNIIATP